METDFKADPLNKKVRKAQLESFNYIGVIGKEEVNTSTISIRERGKDQSIGRLSVTELLNLFDSEKPVKSRLRVEL